VTPYTGVPGNFNLTADLLDDDDAPSAAAIHSSVEQCLDNDAALDQRVTAIEAAPLLIASVQGSGLNPDDKLPITSDVAKGTWSIASNEIQVPKAGWYRVSVHCRILSSAATNPSWAVITVFRGAIRALLFSGMRFSERTFDPITISGSGLVRITNPATEKLSLLVDGVGPFVASATEDDSKVHISYEGQL